MGDVGRFVRLLPHFQKAGIVASTDFAAGFLQGFFKPSAPPCLFQHPLLAFGLSTLELRYLAVAFMLERGAEAFEQIGAGKLPLGIPQGLAEIVCEGPVVAPFDVGIGRGLIVPAAGKQDMVRGVGGSQQPGLRKVLLIHLPAEDVDRGRQKTRFDRLLRAE